MGAKESILKSINRVAETQFLIRPLIDEALKMQQITNEGKRFLNGANTYHEYWVNSFGDKFHDMGTIVRIGTEIENGLKYYYMEKRGHANLVELRSDPHYVQNIFQRVLPWTQQGARDLFIGQVSYDLNTNSHFAKIQEIMLYRHLYAHNSGLLNEKFVNDLKRLINLDLSQDAVIGVSYPQQDTYYFAPIDRIHEFIETSRDFINELP